MSKRQADSEHGARLVQGARPEPQAVPDEAGDFEDEFEDEFESEDEDEIIEAGVDGRPDAEREAEEREAMMDIDQDTFVPGRNNLAAGESLAPDMTAYDMIHVLESPWPCLSLDILKDQLGDNRTSYPQTVYAVAGTQAETGKEKENRIMVMKLDSLSRTDKGEQSESEDESDGEEEGLEPVLETKAIPVSSTTNRIRAHRTAQPSSSQPATTLAASMMENGNVLIHDITPHLSAFDTPGSMITPSQNKPLCTIRAHAKTEGYALDWSPTHNDGRLLTGDLDGKIFLTTRTAGGGFVTDTTPFTGHDGAINEIQWQPNERNAFATTGDDGSVKIWDTRSRSKKPMLSVKCSNTDVNVLSWSHVTPHLLASGAEDGVWSAWDLRQWKAGGSSTALASPAASFNYHKQQITGVEWHPTDDSVVMVCAGDDTITLWNLSVEFDDEESKDTAGVQDVPPQLMFVHYMKQVKEGKWHPQIPGAVMATGGEGFGVFKTFNV